MFEKRERSKSIWHMQKNSSDLKWNSERVSMKYDVISDETQEDDQIRAVMTHMIDREMSEFHPDTTDYWNFIMEKDGGECI